MVVCLLVMKPEDGPKVLAKIRDIKAFIANMKQEIIAQIAPDLNVPTTFNDDKLAQEMDQINFYLSKIANLGAEYEGEYSLDSIKGHYRRLMNQRVVAELNDKNRIQEI
ncbi:MAG: hypothetical protein Tsb006_7550 [Rickettsiaceae bacterium]